MDIAGNNGNEENIISSAGKEDYLLMRAFSKVISSPWLRLKTDGSLIASGNFNHFPLTESFFSGALQEPSGSSGLSHEIFKAIQKTIKTRQIQRIEHVFSEIDTNRTFELHILQSGEDEVLVVCSEIELDINHRIDVSLSSERLKTEIKRHEARQKSHQKVFEFIRKIHLQTQLDEALSLVKEYGEQIFPNTSAEFLVVKPRTGSLESLTGWGDRNVPVFTVGKDQCPAFSKRSILMEPSLYCKAVLLGDEDQNGYHLCLPVMSKEELYGVLRFTWQDENIYLGGEEFKQTACLFVEQLSSFLEKLQLKQIIKNQSMKDPVSGLYNRKYFMDAMLREIHRVQRNEKTLSILLVKVGNLQEIHKAYGAETFQKVIARFTKLLFRAVRISDLVCHYDREIFVISMAGMGRDILNQRIKEIYLALRNEKYRYEQKIISLNITMGAAVFPENGKKIEDLLDAAEKALLMAGSSEYTGYRIAE